MARTGPATASRKSGSCRSIPCTPSRAPSRCRSRKFDMARREDTWADLASDAALWLDRYEKVLTREIEALRLAAPGVPANALRVDLERGASPMSVARYYASQRN